MSGRTCQRCGAGLGGLDPRARHCECCNGLTSDSYRAIGQYRRAAALADVLSAVPGASAQAIAGADPSIWTTAQRLLGWDKPPSEVTQTLAIVMMAERERAAVRS